jgi:hypothetical protein
MKIVRWLLISLPSTMLIVGVRGYQSVLGPIFGGNCRFRPTCSNYFIEAVRKYGPYKGTAKGIWRICRCNPFTVGRYDPP